MLGDERRAAILAQLKETSEAVSGQALGEAFQVSRQVIVQDIALLRAQGYNIVSTHRGYVLRLPAVCKRTFKVRHSKYAIEDEMNAEVDLGGCIEDVWVNHRTYGVVSAPLSVKTRRDVKRFLDELHAGISSPLSNLTDGYHFHTISAESEEILDEVAECLNSMGMLAPFTEYEQHTFL